MWWVNTFGLVTIVIAVLAVIISAILGWGKSSERAFRAVPAVMKGFTLVTAIGVVVAEVIAIVEAMNGVEHVTVRYAPFWTAIGYTVGDTTPDEMRISSGEFGLANLTTSYLISIAKTWAVIEHTSLIALVVVLSVFVWKIAVAIQRGSFRSVVSASSLLRAGLAISVLGLLWQGSAQTFQITVGRMTHLAWPETPMWPAMIQPQILNYEAIPWPFTDIQVWPLVVGLVLVIAAVVVRKSERDETELEGLI